MNQQPHHSDEAGRAVATGTRSFLQPAVLVICLVQLSFAAVGLLANPNFATGDAATSVQVLGVDFNGWHAVSGLALFAPGLLAARRPDWALVYSTAAIALLLGTALWTLLDSRPAGLLWFPHDATDVTFHVLSATAFAVVLAVHFARHHRRE